MARTRKHRSIQASAAALLTLACGSCTARERSGDESTASSTRAGTSSDTGEGREPTSGSSTAEASTSPQTSAGSSTTRNGQGDTQTSTTVGTYETGVEPTGKEFFECFFLFPMDCGENRACVPYDPQMHGEFSGTRCVEASAPLEPGASCSLVRDVENGQDGACGSGLICAVDPDEPLADGVCVRVAADSNEPGCNFLCEAIVIPLCLEEVGCEATDGFCGVAGCGTVSVL